MPRTTSHATTSGPTDDDLLSAASATLDALADDHAAEQAHDADDGRCTFCALRTVVDKITTNPLGRITDAERD